MRGGRSELTEEHVHALVYDITEDENESQRQVAKFILEDARHKAARKANR